VHPNQKFLYSIGEINNFGGKKAGAVSAFAIDVKTGNSQPLNSQSSGGTGRVISTLIKKATAS
jgi:6-phosphogluconolactonase (cycloisomerase 2 family)